MCDEYGIELNEEHLKDVRSIANDNGEVYISTSAFCTIFKSRFEKMILYVT